MVIEKEKLDQVMRDIFSRSDATSVIICSSVIDLILKELIEKRLVNDSKGRTEELFDDSNGPFNTFSNKIKYCYYSGIISKEIRDELNIIRKIRNKFAHSILSLTFSDEDTKQLINSMSLFRNTNPPEDLIKESENPKSLFRLTAMVVINKILAGQKDGT